MEIPSPQQHHLLFFGEEHECFDVLSSVTPTYNCQVLYASQQETAQTHLQTQNIQAVFFGPDLAKRELISFVSEIHYRYPQIALVILCNEHEALSSLRVLRETIGADYVLYLPLKIHEASLILAELTHYFFKQSNGAVETQLPSIRAHYDSSIYDKLENLEAWIERTQADPTEDNFNAMRATIQRIATEAGPYGHSAAALLCKQWEQRLLDYSSPEQIASKAWGPLNGFLKELAIKLQIHVSTDEPAPNEGLPLEYVDLYLVDEDAEFANTVRKKALQKNWRVMIEHNPRNALKQLQNAQFQPRVFLVSRHFAQSPEISGFDLIETYRKGQQRGISAIVGMIFQKSILEERITAVRQGVELFLIKPLSEEQLFQTLEGISVIHSGENSKVLLLDDDAETCNVLRAYLEEIGCNVKIIPEGSALLLEMEKFQPELLILSNSLPKYDGLELLRILKSDVRHQALPVIITSSSSQPSVSENAYLEGADGYLLKPVHKRSLQIRVHNLIQKRRMTIATRDRDPLTSAFNRRALYEMFQPMLARAMRNKKPLVIAMLDVDHFKIINDTYGHLVGDEVLMRCGMMLTHSFRRTDLVGRWGGEEFVLCLEDMSLLQAQFIVGDFLEHTTERLQFTDYPDLHLTLSAGLAEFPRHGSTLEELIASADRALYLAKNHGRNCLSTAMSSNGMRPEPAISISIEYEDQTFADQLAKSLNLRGFQTTTSLLSQLSETPHEKWPHLIVYQQNDLNGPFREVFNRLQRRAPKEVAMLFVCRSALGDIRKLNTSKRLMNCLRLPASTAAVLEMTLELLHQKQLKTAPLVWETRTV